MLDRHGCRRTEAHSASCPYLREILERAGSHAGPVDSEYGLSAQHAWREASEIAQGALEAPDKTIGGWLPRETLAKLDEAMGRSESGNVIGTNFAKPAADLGNPLDTPKK
jgi:hypothetical protein